MGVKQWTGLIMVVLFVNVQVQGWFLDPEPAAVATSADDKSVQRDGVTCLSPDDCLSDECCLANVRPIAKRSARTKRWFFETTPSEGVCQRLGTNGSPCIVPVSGIFPDPKKEIIALDMCPCAADFICVVCTETAPTVVPQGEVGSCEPKKPETENTELLQLLNDKEEEADSDNNDEALTDNDDAPSENDNVDNDDNTDKDNDDEAEPEDEEKEEDEEKVEEEVEEEGEEEKPLENTIDDFPAEQEDEQ